MTKLPIKMLKAPSLESNQVRLRGSRSRKSGAQLHNSVVILIEGSRVVRRHRSAKLTTSLSSWTRCSAKANTARFARHNLHRIFYRMWAVESSKLCDQRSTQARRSTHAKSWRFQTYLKRTLLVFTKKFVSMEWYAVPTP